MLSAILSIIEGLPEAALALDREQKICGFNNRAAYIFDLLRVGDPVSLTIRQPEFLDAIGAVRSGEPSVTVQFERNWPVTRQLEVTLVQIAHDELAHDVHGRIDPGQPDIFVTIRDTAEQETLARMRMNFIANASHELRTPLASLLGFVETLQGAARDDEAAREKFLAIMAGQARRMTRLIDDLLSLSRLEMSEHVPLDVQLEINQLVEPIAEMMRPIADGDGARIKVERLKGGAYVRGEKDELVQVFQNLIQNAVRYGRQGGQVQVRVQRRKRKDHAGHWISISVKDDGPGIAAKHLPHLTERFYRVSKVSSREKGGTGLGLAIVKHVINRHRGELVIKSRVGKGSTFTVNLPESSPQNVTG